MARYEVLNNVVHADLRVVTHFGAAYGDSVGMLPAFPTEFAELQREYPIFLKQDTGSGEYQPVILLGFEPRENLFLHEGRWAANYLPGAVARGSFLIGFQQRGTAGEPESEPVIHVDMEHPRIGTDQGEAVFLPHGGHSPYLEHIITVLRGIHGGAQASSIMCAAFKALDLIQPVQLDVRFDSEHGVKVGGLHGIDRQRLAALGPTELHALHQAGWLEGAHLMLASQHNVRRLLAEKQRRLRTPSSPSSTAERVA